MSELLDPEFASTTGNPDASLQDWLNDPASAEWVKQQAKAHASALLGFTDPSGTNIDANSGMPTDPLGSAPAWTPLSKALPDIPPSTPQAPIAPDASSLPRGIAPTSPIGRLKALFGSGGSGSTVGKADPTAEQGPYIMNKGPPQAAPTPAPTPASPLDPVETADAVPIPTPRPAEAPAGASDVSAKSKTPKADAISDFAKTLAGVKPIQPPPLNAVGTPSVHTPGAISAPQITQLLQLLGSQSKPDPVQTLGRLLVAGKA